MFAVEESWARTSWSFEVGVEKEEEIGMKQFLVANQEAVMKGGMVRKSFAC